MGVSQPGSRDGVESEYIFTYDARIYALGII